MSFTSRSPFHGLVSVADGAKDLQISKMARAALGQRNLVIALKWQVAPAALLALAASPLDGELPVFLVERIAVPGTPRRSFPKVLLRVPEAVLVAVGER